MEQEAGEGVRVPLNVEEQVFGTVHKLTELGLEVIVVIVLAIVCGACSLYFGKDRAIAALFALLGAFTLSRHFPKDLITIPEGSEGLVALAIFAALTVLLYFALSRFIATDFPGSTIFRFAEVSFLGVALASMLMLVLYHVANVELWYNFTNQVDSLFASSSALFWWLLANIIGLLVIIKR